MLAKSSKTNGRKQGAAILLVCSLGSVLAEYQSYEVSSLYILIHINMAEEEACANCCLGSTATKFIR